MRELDLLIDEALVNGLSPDENLPFNSQFLSQCLGFKCGTMGLKPYDELTNPLSGAFSVQYSWPFPQFISGEFYNFLIMRDETNSRDLVYNVSSDHQTLTLIATLNYSTYGIGDLMEVADFGKYMMMTNGKAIVYWNAGVEVPVVLPFTLEDEFGVMASSSTIPGMKTICNFKGQLVGGNVTTEWHSCDSSFYIWSKIGQADFTPDQKNTAGFRRCPYGGDVYHVRRLDDNVIGYSSRGITMLKPVSSPAATFGFIELDDIGLINQGAVNGSLKKQLYVGEDYKLRKITSSGIEVLGYQHHLEELTGEDIIINYEPYENKFYIGNSSKTFLMTDKGMSEIPQHPSAVWRIGGQSYMLPETVDTFDYTLASEIFDFGYRGQKTIFSMESTVGYSQGASVMADFRLSDTFVSTSYIDLNNQGIAAIIAAGNEFRFKLKLNSMDSNDIISYLRVKYKMTDLRGLRGIYAPPPRGQ